MPNDIYSVPRHWIKRKEKVFNSKNNMHERAIVRIVAILSSVEKIPHMMCENVVDMRKTCNPRIIYNLVMIIKHETILESWPIGNKGDTKEKKKKSHQYEKRKIEKGADPA